MNRKIAIVTNSNGNYKSFLDGKGLKSYEDHPYVHVHNLNSLCGLNLNGYQLIHGYEKIDNLDELVFDIKSRMF